MELKWVWQFCWTVLTKDASLACKCRGSGLLSCRWSNCQMHEGNVLIEATGEICAQASDACVLKLHQQHVTGGAFSKLNNLIQPPLPNEQRHAFCMFASPCWQVLRISWLVIGDSEAAESKLKDKRTSCEPKNHEHQQLCRLLLMHPWHTVIASSFLS